MPFWVLLKTFFVRRISENCCNHQKESIWSSDQEEETKVQELCRGKEGQREIQKETCGADHA